MSDASADAVAPSGAAGSDGVPAAGAADAAVDPLDGVARLDPEAAIGRGRSGAATLLTLWFVRKSFYWLAASGYILGTYMAYLNHEDAQLDVEWTNPDSVQEGVLSPWAPLIVALAIRFVVGRVALFAAWPLARHHHAGLPPQTGFGSGISRLLDRYGLAKAFRQLRWSHHVRQAAKEHLSPRGRRLAGRLDPIMDIANIASVVLAVLVVFGVAFATATATAA